MRPHTRPARSWHASRRAPTRPTSYPAVLEDRTAAGTSADDPSRRLAVELRSDLVRPRLTVAGELDVSSASLLAAMLDHVHSTRRRGPGGGAGDVEVDVDLGRVTFADSHGMAPVLDGPARIVGASEPVRRLLRLLGAEPEPVRGPV